MNVKRVKNAVREYGADALCVAASGVAVFLMPLFWRKLALRTAVYLDWDGVCAAFSELLPGGVLRYVARLGIMCGMEPWVLALLVMAQAAVLLVAWRVCAFPDTKGTYRALLRFVAPMTILALVFRLGTSVWTFQETAFPFVLGLSFLMTLLVLGVARLKGPWVLVFPLLFPWLGLPAILCGVCVCVADFCRGRIVRGVAGICGTVATVVVSSLGPYAVLAPTTMLAANMPWLCEPYAIVWNILVTAPYVAVIVVLATVHVAWHTCRAWVAYVTVFIMVAGVWLLREGNTGWQALLRVQDALERGDYAVVLRIKSTTEYPSALLSAYRTVAMFHTGELPERLFAFPIVVPHNQVTFDFVSFDAGQLFFHYGCFLPARRYCYEKAVSKGFSAETLRLLGRIALGTREASLAYRYFTQLKRIPFFADEADRMIRFLFTNDQTLLPTYLPTLFEIHERLSVDPGNITFQSSPNAETHIYERYAMVKSGNEQMIRMYFAASLLIGSTNPFLENLGVLHTLYPAGLPRYYAEGLLYALSQLPENQRPELPSNMIRVSDYHRFLAFQKDEAEIAAMRSPSDADVQRFFNTYRDTFYLYKKRLTP